MAASQDVARVTRASHDRLVVFMDDATLLPDLSAIQDAVVVSLDAQAASELGTRPALSIRCASEYAEERFPSYDELYDHYEAQLRERLRPKDPLNQSRFLFDAFWDDILLNLVGVCYIEKLIQAVLDREKPTRVEFAISDRELNALFRKIVQRLS